MRDTDENGAVTAAGLAVAPEPAPGPSTWPVLRSFVDLAAIVQRRFAGMFALARDRAS